ncbi:hypothetical protein AJ79_07623 [Helicocarpus griseus UAMH5409]|uniref:DUF1682 domain-containing protein n=1 Tax=Helicocarpus griseus UAMH5409 TaxID=1447875 RepID=A0A2B7X0Z1_9EURO|nr:hypothetical protein AJ79_07623 [Helicocarpus griseus UAMH5409]
MSGLLQNILKGGAESPSPAPASGDDADFADFAANIPSPPPVASISTAPSAATANTPLAGTSTARPFAGHAAVPYTKWYRVWERTSPADFVQEAFILPFLVLTILFHVWGMGRNRRRAKLWAQAHLPTLESEFAVVGYGGVPSQRSQAQALTGDGEGEVQAEGLLKESGMAEVPENVLKEKMGTEFATYATGRQNVAFVDVTVKLVKRFNPLYLVGDYVLSVFFDSWAAPVEKVECVAYAFDGKEKDLVPAPSAADREAVAAGQQRGKGGAGSSAYDGFVFAIVHKNCMRKLREDRYDISLTFTRDNPKLPEWATVMSESAEVTDMMLTNDLIKAVQEAGENFEYLIISDQPLDKPTKIDETIPRKRITLSLRLPSSNGLTAYAPTLPIFTHFLRLPDRLVQTAHFRAEVARKLRSTRDEEIRRLRRADEEEKAEERKLAAERVKKEERERLLRSMSAEEQRKYLEKEREREAKRGMKRSTRRG